MTFIVLFVAICFSVLQFISNRHLINTIAIAENETKREEFNAKDTLTNVTKRFNKVFFINLINVLIAFSFFVAIVIITPSINVITIIASIAALLLFGVFSIFSILNVYMTINKILQGTMTKTAKYPLIITGILHGLTLFFLVFGILSIYL